MRKSAASAVLLLLPLILLVQCFTSSCAFQPIGARRSSVPTSVAQSHRRVSHTTSGTQCDIAPCYSRLFSTVGEGGDSSENERNNKWQRKNPLVVIKKVVARFTATWVVLSSRFATLSKRAKIIVATQLLALTLLVGAGARQYMFSNGPPSVHQRPVDVPYSTFMDLCEKGAKNKGKQEGLDIVNVVIGSDRIGYQVVKAETSEQRSALERFKKGEALDSETNIPLRSAYTRKVNASPELVSFLRQHDIPFRAATKKAKNSAAMALQSCVLIFYLLLMVRMYRMMNGGGGGATGAPGKLASSDLPLAKFEDIEGIDNAKFEVMELVDTLRNPGKYSILGARAPTGLLLEGPPGTGKTMLARATAATAGVPLLYCSGSDFVEMYVGRGAARVRKTFERASKLAPCIIFIDELDALGKSRENSMFRSSSDEAEQTLNQLLACMDGLDSTRGICVLAATNRKDVLDQALVRPGRFDRIVKVDLPNAAGRARILRVHAKKLPGFKEGKGVDEKRLGSLGKGHIVDLSAVAAVTPGLSGAELEFIVNEAAIRAVRRVSGQLREGQDPNKITPSVQAEDFESSVKNFYTSRKPSGGGMGELLGNVLRN